MIAIETLQVVFKDHAALKGVSLNVARGESYGLVGESGSGKSTILRAIVGLAAFQGGGITIDGTPLPGDGRRGRDLLRRVQMVFQDPFGSLHPRQTVDRCLREGPAVMGLAEIEARIDRALEDVGLDAGYRRRYPHQLSGGQRQRVAIARALITDPEILLLDEPTSALDVSIQAEILNLLADLRRGRGLTFLFVSHNLPVIGHMCDRLGVLRAGELVEEVAADGLYSGAVAHPYTQSLLAEAAGYRRRTGRRKPRSPVPRKPDRPIDADRFSLAAAMQYGLKL
jgi:peptide/nickel transport system ATP-binding protein